MKVFYRILMTMLAAIFFLSVKDICSFHRQVGENEKEREEIIQEVVRPQTKKCGKEEIEDMKIDFDKLEEINADTVGWMMFHNECVNTPLVQTTNNSYYLNHSFMGEENAAGCIFVDYRNDLAEDKNVVVYGHNMTDQSMFGSLKEVFSDAFWEEEDNAFIWITDTDNHVRKYQIFSCYTVKDEEYYITTTFDSNEEYRAFLEEIKRRSARELEVDVSVNDRILTLSTCAGAAGAGRRRVIHAKLSEESSGIGMTSHG